MAAEPAAAVDGAQQQQQQRQRGAACGEETQQSQSLLHKEQGNALLRAGKHAEAAAAYGLAIEANPTVAALWSNRSLALLSSGDAAGALRDAEEAARLQPAWSKAHYRRARALQELGRPQEAAEACAAGLEVAGAPAEVRELRQLREAAVEAAAAGLLGGWWHGTVSLELGAYLQEFCFLADGELKCVVYDQELSGKYTVQNVEATAQGGLQGGIDVSLNNERVPYLFRIDVANEEARQLHLCCPMSSASDRPRSFHGPGYVAMRPGRRQAEQGEGLASLTEGQRVLRCLGELAEAWDSKLEPGPSDGGAAAARLLEEAEEGGTMSSQAVVGTETLEDKGKQMAHENHLQALRVKYADGTYVAAQRLVKGEVEPAGLYPAEAEDLGRLLRRLRRAEADAESSRAPPPAPAPPAPEPPSPPQTPAAALAAAGAEAMEALHAALADEPAAAAPVELSAPVLGKQPAAAAQMGGGCCQGCFAGLRRR